MVVRCRRHLERVNAEEEQAAQEALQLVQAEREKDEHAHLQMLLQAEEVKASSFSCLHI